MLRLVTRHVDNAMAKAIARAFRWRDTLESGEYVTIREIALRPLSRATAVFVYLAKPHESRPDTVPDSIAPGADVICRVT